MVANRGLYICLPFLNKAERLDTVELCCQSLVTCVALFPYPLTTDLPFLHVYKLHGYPHTHFSSSRNMAENDLRDEPQWMELNLPGILLADTVQELHDVIQNDWDSLRKSACQTAAGRALWKHVTQDPLADLLAGEIYLRSLHEKIKNDLLNNAREISGVILAVRTLWFDSKLGEALSSFSGDTQVVLLGADVLEVKSNLLEAAMELKDEHRHPALTAKSLKKVPADIRSNDWFQKLQMSGFVPEKSTVWILEGILYYLSDSEAMQVLKIIADKSALAPTVLLADFMNKLSTMMASSIFHFYSDWPDHLLPSLGFSHVKLSQIGDPDADFGLMDDPLNMFNTLRSLPRSMQTYPNDGKPCCRLYLVQASGFPNQT